VFSFSSVLTILIVVLGETFVASVMSDQWRLAQTREVPVNSSTM
jgi:hypothetical protein